MCEGVESMSVEVNLFFSELCDGQAELGALPIRTGFSVPVSHRRQGKDNKSQMTAECRSNFYETSQKF